MKNALLLLVSICFLLTGCNSKNKPDNNSKSSTSYKVYSTANDNNSSELIDGVLPFMFYHNGKLHNASSDLYTLYDGAFLEFDYSLIDGYVLIGETYDRIDSAVVKPSYELQTNFMDDGTPVLYNEKTNRYIFWIQDGRSWLTVMIHNCEE